MKLALVLIFASRLMAGLDAVKAEHNLERRSELALANAESALDKARETYKNGDEQPFKSALEELSESIDLCKQSLDESGKNARKSPKYFKKAEIGIRHLIRRLDNFRIEMSIDDRGPVEKLQERAHGLQEAILHEIMGKKK